MVRGRVLVVGNTEVARLACTALVDRGFRVDHLSQPTGDELVAALTAEHTAVAVLVRGDVTALRYALLAEHHSPEVRLIVTLFDRTVGDELVRVVPNCVVTSPADIAVPSVIGACLSDDYLAVGGGSAAVVVAGDPDDPVESAWQRPGVSLRSVLRVLARQCRPYESSGRTLLTGLGLVGFALAAELVLGITVLDEPLVPGLYVASRVVATVGPATAEAHGDVPEWYLVVSALLMLLTVAAVAIFTAGLVDRLLSRRLTGIIGRRTLPRADHVVVIGVGQVGVRLAAQLKSLGVPVVGVEREADAPGLRRLKELGIPGVVGDGSDARLLRRLGIRRARALAAMSSDDLDNVETAIAVRAVSPETRVVIRAGDDEVIAETKSLFKIAQVRHVSALTAAAVASATGGTAAPRWVYQDGHRLLALTEDGIEVCTSLHRCRCESSLRGGS